MFHFHKWSDWAITERGRVVDTVYSHRKLGSYLIQERFCPTCGKTQLKSTRTTMLSNVILIPESQTMIPKKDKVT